MLLLLLVLGGYPLGQQKAVTEDGKGVILKPDGTWEYTEVFQLSEKGVALPRLVKRTIPSYTQAAKAAEVQGVVLLDCVVRKSGRADKCKVVKSLAHGSTERAIEEVETNWRFEAGRFQGQPVDVESIIEISFNDP